MAPLVHYMVALALWAVSCNAFCLPRNIRATLPLSEVGTALPAPSGELKTITLGLGYQNYTCTSSGTYVQNVAPAGAIARLYDITTTVGRNSGDRIAKSTLRSFEKCLKLSRCTPTTENNFCGSCHRVAAAAYRRNDAGEHFFDQIQGAQLPNFDIQGTGDFISAKRSADCKAPAGAYSGENGLGAINWVYLVDNGSGRTSGLSSLYRVHTAGGVAPSTCTVGSTLQVPYATEYWFYE